jgi:hypothetical protein
MATPINIRPKIEDLEVSTGSRSIHPPKKVQAAELTALWKASDSI